jgi:hypothetical protein
MMAGDMVKAMARTAKGEQTDNTHTVWYFHGITQGKTISARGDAIGTLSLSYCLKSDLWTFTHLSLPLSLPCPSFPFISFCHCCSMYRRQTEEVVKQNKGKNRKIGSAHASILFPGSPFL